ncbi:DUF2332 domain-containing protein [Herbiconiux sp. L3-i23]|uniref:DUF2332 domain-containing protein n=1 Tax=Herbiconiux sp. L3-i23 TaxID=2905871 RepID=UPI00204B7064|nr:DUF2332 domain-containing protein [Herbiconiux sp. L3-i23]BDI23218.1 hypothetical protein L3i23_19940 [Herbiconiux sp. L3-i23]
MTAEDINESLTAERYRVFSQIDAHDLSPSYVKSAVGIASDPSMLEYIDSLPPSKRHAGYLFSVARYLEAPLDSYDRFKQHLIDRWDEVERIARERTMQTNDPARLLALLPVLAGIEGPIALLEVGASAGLLLNADRYSYQYDDGPWLHPADGPSEVRLTTETRGPVPVPERMPQIVWRAGIEMNPLDLEDPDDVAWLSALLWPDDPSRVQATSAAIELMRREPVRIVPGDLNDELARLAETAPPEATLVVMHSAVLSYLTQEDADRFVATVRALGAVWIANELADVVPGVSDAGERDSTESFSFVVAKDGVPVARTHPHGAWVRWLTPTD